MLKKLQTISWGGWSAFAALVFFLGLAVYPVLTARAAESGATSSAYNKREKKDGLLAMIDKAKEKEAEAKNGHHEEHGPKRIEVKALACTADSTLYLGTKTGLYRVPAAGQTPVLVAALPAADVKALATAPDGTLYVATKMGAYRLSADAATATSIHEGDTQSLTVQADSTLYLATKHQGLLTSRDQGASWTPLVVELPLDTAMRGGPKTDEQKAKEKAEREAAKAAKAGATS